LAYFLEEVGVERIKPGMPLRIEVSSIPGFTGGDFKSKVEDIVDNLLKAGMPSMKGRLVPMPVGITARISAVDKKSLYVFYGYVLKNEEEGNIPITVFNIRGKIRRIQRRRFLRIQFVSQGALRILGTDERVPFMTLDVSAGGMKIATKSRLEIGVMVGVDFKFEEGLELKNQEATILREGRSESEDLHVYGIAFLNMPFSMQDKIMKFVFKLELKSKGGKEE